MDLTAKTKHPCWAVTEAGEEVYLDGTYDIDSTCSRGVYVVTPGGLAFLDYAFMRWAEKTATAPSGLLEEAQR